MKTKSNPISIARTLCAVHAAWVKLPQGEELGETLIKRLATLGRKDLSEVLQSLRSLKGRMDAVEGVTRTESMVNDAKASARSEEARMVRRAVEILEGAI